MARENGPVATVQNKSGSVSKTQSIPANVGTPSVSNMSAPKAQRASHGHTISDGGVGFTADARHMRGREDLYGSSQAKSGFTSRGIKSYGAKRSVGPTAEVAIGPRPK